MKILVLGASGFVGRHFAAALQTQGHEVIRGVRKPRLPTDIAVDFCEDTDKATWLPRLIGVDVVINAVGVLRDSKQQPMALLHEQTPLALFAACQEAGVKRIVQVSALGVDHGIETAYFQTRRKVENYLIENFRVSALTLRQAQGERAKSNTVRAEPVLSLAEGSAKARTTTENTNSTRYLILRPSLVYGSDGASAKLFTFLASLPLHLLTASGKQRVQPVHIDDTCLAVSNWLASAPSQCVECVGAEVTDMRGLIDSYRAQLGHNTSALHLNIPAPLVKLSARLGDFIPASPLCSDTLQMLNAGNIGDAAPFAKLLGRQPLSYRQFIKVRASNGK